MRNFFIISGAILISLFGSFSANASVDVIANECNYKPVEGENPSMQMMNCLLTKAALHNDIPPEIVKAIAEGESGDWRHFDENGEAIVTDDNGIGIMQITNQANYDEDRLKSDVVYNILAGVEILDYMFDRADLPKINNGDRNTIEHWYFAVMAYNGTKPVNSPIIQETGERNDDAYQEKIFQHIRDYGLIDDVKTLPFTRDDFDYDPNSSDNINFVTMDYQFDFPLTKSKHFFKPGDTVGTVSETNLRTTPSTVHGLIKKLDKGEKLTVTGDFVYDNDPNKKNHFVWYPVRLSDGTEGFVASSYLRMKFKDVPVNHYSEEAIYYLVDRGILHGKNDGTFGFNENLTRWQAVLLVNRATNISLENRPDPGFVDVPQNYLYYKDVAAAVDEGYFQGFSDTEFKLNNQLKRSEMAAVLDRIFNFPNAEKPHPFTDIGTDRWFTGPVHRLYESDITQGVTETRFGPGETMTREQFAVFLARAVNEDLRNN